MRLLVTLLLVFMTYAVSAEMTCQSEDFFKLTTFSQEIYHMTAPCKYIALKQQQCGDYKITLTPGNKWVRKHYYIDTLWLGIEKTTTPTEKWEGRTSNKLAIKYINDKNDTRNLLQAPDGEFDYATFNEYFEISVKNSEDKKWAIISAANGDFDLSFTPWNPEANYTKSMFKFVCNRDNVLNPFPFQLCGNRTKVITELTKNGPGAAPFSLSDRETTLVVLYYLFMNDLVAQTDEKCQETVTIFRDVCQDFNTTVRALQNCQQIIASKAHTTCVTRFSCDPIDIFNACMTWGCTGQGFEKDNIELCTLVGEGIDLCPNFEATGNLSARMKAYNCYKDFLPIKKGY